MKVKPLQLGSVVEIWQWGDLILTLNFWLHPASCPDYDHLALSFL